MSNIIAISGKKQSGKTTCGNFLFGCAMVSNEVVEYAYIDNGGNLVVPYEDSDGELSPCVFPVDSMHPGMVSYMQDNVWAKLKTYNFADNLKRICIDILGLSEQQCYGTEKEKNANTQFNWSEMLFEEGKRSACPMTAREVMQYIGTDFFRKIYPNVWVESTIRKIKRENPELAVVVDCRFPNEVEGIQEAGGKVIRLTRDVEGLDTHASETALDGYAGFDAVIDNTNMNIGEQNEAVYNQLVEWGFVNFSAVAGTHKSA